jgi:hypothetical protein
MKLRIKPIHGEKVEEGARPRGGEVLAVPDGHQQHLPIHHILPKNSLYSWVFRYIFGCGVAKDGCDVIKHECGVAKDGCGVAKDWGGAAKYECVSRRRRELGAGKYWLFQPGTSTTSRSITSCPTFLFIHQHTWALAD